MRPTPIERFLAKVEWGQPFEGTRCLLWIGTKTRPDESGYGLFTFQGRSVLAHRWLYERWIGPIPSGMQLDHLCRVRRCVNPDHAEPVTASENVKRSRWREGICKNGHVMDEASIFYRADGGRGCRICRLEQQRARRNLARSEGRPVF